ncbi:hypothetical protein MML48_2g00019320 [Holotrichia oblita]|uniref:Uncharacterized protein n=1 Tax=Holotrichia oblita TaxID=644536 RepID=A0ACB9TPJ9_HOLOL|nr:hypothetical protein MML48_2g00019320 [Holotrichia oblita]
MLAIVHSVDLQSTQTAIKPVKEMTGSRQIQYKELNKDAEIERPQGDNEERDKDDKGEKEKEEDEAEKEEEQESKKKRMKRKKM